MLGALLGGLAGILFPAAGAGAAATGIGALLGKAALPALGAGLGTLAMGGGGKDAIRNALMFGAGAAFMPGAVQGIRESGFGKGITAGLGELFGMGGQEAAPAVPSMSSSNVRPRPRPAGLGSLFEPLMAPDTGQGMTGMEEDARSSFRTTLPTLGEMATMGRVQSEDRAARAFDLAESLPVGMSLDEAVLEIGPDIMGYGPGRVDPRLYMAASRQRRAVPRSEAFAMGGAVEGPGTGTSDSIPAEIYQDGKPVQKAKLSDGEFVMTAAAVKGAGNGDRDRGISRMYELMRRFERGEMA